MRWTRLPECFRADQHHLHVLREEDLDKSVHRREISRREVGNPVGYGDCHPRRWLRVLLIDATPFFALTYRLHVNRAYYARRFFRKLAQRKAAPSESMDVLQTKWRHSPGLIALRKEVHSA